MYDRQKPMTAAMTARPPPVDPQGDEDAERHREREHSQHGVDDPGAHRPSLGVSPERSPPAEIPADA